MPYTREAIDRAIRAAAEAMGEPLTKDAYRTYRNREGGPDSGLPSVATLSQSPNGYDIWTAACAANDIASGTSGRPAISTAARVAALRNAAAERGEPLQLEEYRDWRTDDEAPHIGGAYNTPPGIDGWADWCLLAGVEPAGKKTWTPLECLQAVRRAAAAVDGTLSEHAYRAWRHDQEVLLPGRAAISTHWPSFPAARAIAVGKREEVPPEAWAA